jgi:hypothetical protein
MQPAPPHVQAAVDELLACAPPLTPEQERLIRRFYAQAEPQPGQGDDGEPTEP